MMLRREKIEIISSAVNLGGIGLELGPNVMPMFRKSAGYKVKYLESRGTEEMRQDMIAAGRDPELVEEIDFILKRDIPLKENVNGASFDWVGSSHVLEHIPDLVGHLNDVRSVLKPGGLYAAIVPDRNFCFDCLKPFTSLGEVLEAHIEGRKTPTIASNIDELRYGVRPEGIKVGGWTREQATAPLVAKYPGWEQRVHAILDAGVNRTNPWLGHSWQFDPKNFADIVCDLSQLGLIGLELEMVRPTYNMDFIVLLRHVEAIDLAEVRRLTRVVAESYAPARYPTTVAAV